MKNYSGSDLGQDFKNFFRKEKTRLTKVFKEKGCTKIEMHYGFYFFSGFFTAPSGQVYYISSSDVRSGYSQLLIRTAMDYKDYRGGINQYCEIKGEDLLNFKLQ